MKIILACEIFPPDIGGPATYAVQLAEALQKAGHEVRVISYGEVHPLRISGGDSKPPFRAEYNNRDKQDSSVISATSHRKPTSGSNGAFPLALVSRRIPFFLRQIVYFLKLLSLSRGSNVIYAQGPSVGPAAVWVRRFWKIPVVVKFVGDQSWQQIRMKGSKVAFEDYMRAYGKHWYDLKTFWIQRWQKFSLREADRIVVPSQYLKKIVTEYLGVDEKRVTVIPNGVEINTEEVVRHASAFAKASADKRNDILFVGRFENWKGLDTLIDALQLLPEDFTLTLAGDGTEYLYLVSRISYLKLQDRVKMVGRIPHHELKKYFSHALCFVEGTQYEGMPHVVLESWSFGVPVIISDFPANIELVRDGETGLVFKLEDQKDLASKILMLSSDPQLWDHISRLAFEEHKKYDKNKVMEKTIEFLVTISKFK